MTIGVGLCVGDDTAAAAVVAPGTEIRTLELPAVISTVADGTVQLGEPGPDATNVVRNLIAQAGTPGGIAYAGTMTRAEDLIATALFCLFREIAQGLTANVVIIATYPASWDDGTVTALRESLDYMGLVEAQLVSDADALAADADTAGGSTDADTAGGSTDADTAGGSTDKTRETQIAQGAALIAAGAVLTASAADADTDAIAVVVPDEANAAYSAVLPAVVIASSKPAAAATADAADGKTKPDRFPAVAGVAAGSALLLGGALIVAALQLTGSDDVEQSHGDASPTTTFNQPSPLLELAPTTTTMTTTTVEPAPTTTTRKPTTTSVYVPPPPPVIITTTVPPVVTTTTVPPVTTTEPTTTTTTTTTTPTTTTEQTDPPPDPPGDEGDGE